VAVIEIERAALPKPTIYRAFTPKHLLGTLDQVEIGSSLLVVGFPLGFHDTLHHMPVVRHAVIASSFGLVSRAMALPHRRAHSPGHQWCARRDARFRARTDGGRSAVDTARRALGTARCRYA
jgi:hypothetical protein